MKIILLTTLLALAAPAHAQSNWDVLNGKKTEPARPDGKPATGLPGQPAKPDGKPTAGPVAPTPAASAVARRDFDVASIELQATRLYLTGIADLSADTATWDKQHSIELFNLAQTAVIGAENQFAHLSTLAKDNWAAAAEPVTRGRAGLVNVESQLRQVAQSLRQGQMNQAGVKQVEQLLDSAEKDLQNAANAMKVDLKLRTP